MFPLQTATDEWNSMYLIPSLKVRIQKVENKKTKSNNLSSVLCRPTYAMVKSFLFNPNTKLKNLSQAMKSLERHQYRRSYSIFMHTRHFCSPSLNCFAVNSSCGNLRLHRVHAVSLVS